VLTHITFNLNNLYTIPQVTAELKFQMSNTKLLLAFLRSSLQLTNELESSAELKWNIVYMK